MNILAMLNGKKTLMGLAVLFLAYLGKDLGWLTPDMFEKVMHYGALITGVGATHKLDKAKGH